MLRGCFVEDERLKDYFFANAKKRLKIARHLMCILLYMMFFDHKLIFNLNSAIAECNLNGAKRSAIFLCTQEPTEIFCFTQTCDILAALPLIL
ncbi:MAG TPA: hypothetical protein DEP63_01455 [Candidatus Magasanikbacteria bacterium]|nr:hypothetical protein [Candidatus Magasanikbacteria bacterium]